RMQAPDQAMAQRRRQPPQERELRRIRLERQALQRITATAPASVRSARNIQFSNCHAGDDVWRWVTGPALLLRAETERDRRRKATPRKRGGPAGRRFPAADCIQYPLQRRKIRRFDDVIIEAELAGTLLVLRLAIAAHGYQHALARFRRRLQRARHL